MCCFLVGEGARAFVRFRRVLPTKPQKTTPQLTPSLSRPALAMQLGSPHPRRQWRQHQKRVYAANKWNGYGPSCFLQETAVHNKTRTRNSGVRAVAGITIECVGFTAVSTEPKSGKGIRATNRRHVRAEFGTTHEGACFRGREIDRSKKCRRIQTCPLFEKWSRRPSARRRRHKQQ